MEAFHIQEFLNTGHEYGVIVGESIREVLQEITSNHFRPVQPAHSSTSRTRSGTGKQDVLPSYPQDWGHDRVLFRAAVNNFKRSAGIPVGVANSRHASLQLPKPPKPHLDIPQSSTERYQVDLHTSTQSSDLQQLASDLHTSTKKIPFTPHSNMSGTGNTQANTPQPQFTEAQMQELAQFMDARDREQRQRQGGDPPPPPSPDSTNPDPARSDNTKEWNADEIGYFDPNYEGTDPVVTVGKSVLYRDVYTFIDRLKDMALVRGEDKLRTAIPLCLRGSALIWHTTELSDLEKRLLRSKSTPVEEWYITLTARFKERTPLALAKMQASRYTMADARDRKDPRFYVQDVMRYAKAANLTSVQNQLSMAWNNLDWEFRLHIPEPTSVTTIQDFLAALNAKADMWYEMAGARLPRGSYRPTHKDKDRGGDRPSYKDRKQTSKQDRGRRGNTLGAGNGNDALSGLLNLLAGAQSNLYKGRIYDKQYQNRLSDGSKPAPLQITEGNKSDSRKPYTKNYKSKDYSKDKDKGKGRQQAYVAEEEDGHNEDIDYYDPDQDYDEDDDSESISSDDATANMTSESDADIVIDETSVNLVTFPQSHKCRSCGGIFDSNNKLHKHLRRGCSVPHTSTKTELPTKPKSKFERLGPVVMATSVVTTPTVSSTIRNTTRNPIRNSTVDPGKDSGTGYGFRGWRYATANLSLWEEPSSSPNKGIASKSPSEERGCLDTGAGITICDEAFFNRQTQGRVPIRTMATPITVRGIGSSKHATDRYAIVPISMTGIGPDGAPAVARFRREVHLLSKLKANILLGSDMLGPELVTIDFGKKQAFIGSCEVTVPIDVESRGTASAAIQPAVHIAKLR